MTQAKLTMYAQQLEHLLVANKKDWEHAHGNWRPALSLYDNLILNGEGTRSPTIHIEVPEGTLHIVVVG